MKSSVESEVKERGLKAFLAALLGAALCLLAVNCESVAPRNGWQKRWGPLVPHRTFPGDCGLCHVAERWDMLRPDFAFDHQKSTGYPLEGAHARAACLRCHNDRGPVAAYAARGCGGCHPDPHQSTLGLDCTRCHEQTTWRPTGLIAEHARTRFPLYGVHAAVPCERCHLEARQGQYRGAPVDCDLCHQKDLARATSPDHVASGWTRGCDRCHTPSSFTAANFSHNFFPLTAGHSGLACTRCHTSGTFGPIPSDCYSCHASDYARATPDHAASGFSHDCRNCHTTSGWGSANFNHSFFPLTGGHTGLACTRCHTSGSFGPIPSDCYSCHQADYQRAPNHASLGFPHDCQSCHSSTKWTGSTFRHTFPLSGPHNVSCTSCHDAGSTTTFNCLGCHQPKSAVDLRHSGIRNYSYDSAACFRCHPTGRGG